MPRRKGSVNYKNDVLIQIVSEILPNGEYGWNAVATAYQNISKEEVLRDTNDIKKHWIKNLCNNMKKPTGATGENGDRVNRCMKIEKKIMQKTNSGLLGFSSEDENRNLSDAGDDSRGEEGEKEGDYLLGADDDIFRTDPAPDTNTTDPAPAAPASIRPPQNDTNESERVTPTATNNDVICVALKKAGSSASSSKTKNSSNKNKERTSVAGAIVKLIEQNAMPASSTNIAATATMTLLRQMERMNQSMDKRDRQEKKERRKRKKKRAKRKAQKKAKKAKKKAKKQAAFELLEDHGGKAGGDRGGDRSSSSSSSSSSSDENDSSDCSSISSTSTSDQSSNYGKGSWRG